VSGGRAAWRGLALGAGLLLACGCHADPARQVLGEWRSGGTRMQFYADGQVLMQQDDSTASFARYRLLEEGRMRLTVLGSEGADYRMRVGKDSLVLCRGAAGAACYRMTRVSRP
jgi:hypothetical protein